ncbi:MAG: Dihydrolipoamide acetyltransferase component of pyruvate dehydrogenase complex [Thermoleophilia bacterium]|nr:Dihydrolipoamide acetyltransferase component of pyruvate dehydrogenase complex [Thermoleophilia bacterium]
MATQVKLPRLGQGMDEGKVLQWLKAEGDAVAKGDDLYEVETEKVNVEVEAPADGVVLKVLVGEGETVAIGTTLAWIGAKGESIPDGDAPADAPAPAAAAAAPAPTATPTPSTPAAPVAATPGPAATPAAAPAASTDTRVKASPLARRIASEKGIALEGVAGTGPDGRIVARDIEGTEAPAATAAPQAAPAPVASSAGLAGPGVERVELTSMRRTIARRLTEAWAAPAFYLTRDIDMTAANELRARMLKSVPEGATRPTVSDILTKAAAVALRQHRDMNSHFVGDAILKFADVHVGMAVATPAGLVVPVIRDAHVKTVKEIAADRSALVKKARDGKLHPTEFEGGTFTISNLGMMGIDEFTAVLNPPAAAILSVGRTADRAVVVDRRVVIRPIMTITLGCDHRAVDGAVGAAFLQTLAQHLEDPTSML